MKLIRALRMIAPRRISTGGRHSQWSVNTMAVACVIGAIMADLTNGVVGQEPSLSDGVVITPTPQSNGLHLDWAPPATGGLYTVEWKSSFSVQRWQPLPTFRRWPAALSHWVDFTPTNRRTRFYRVVTTPRLQIERGQVITNQLLEAYSPPALDWMGNYFVGVKPRLTVRTYRLLYGTVDAFGEPCVASAALFLPPATNPPTALVSVHHGTEINRNVVPSRDADVNTWAYTMGLLCATDGYTVVCPDYLGMGDSTGFHPYMHMKSAGTCVADAVRAARSASTNLHILLNGQVFLTGYSQGGNVTLAGHRELESDPS